MSRNIKVKKDVTIKEFIEVLKTIENQDKLLVVPDSDNYGCDQSGI